MLQVTFCVSPEGNTVPYPALFDDIRQNNGFVDVRGRPDLAAEILEAVQCPPLQELLVELAAPNSPLSTLGCDIGETETDLQDDRRFTAGGYVQWVLGPPDHSGTEGYDSLAQAIADALEPHSEGYDWVLTFENKYVDLQLEGHSGLVPSHWLWFDAFGPTASAARAARDDLLVSLAAVLSQIDFKAFARPAANRVETPLFFD